MTATPICVNAKILRATALPTAKMLTVHKRSTYPCRMDQTEPGGQLRSIDGGTKSMATTAKDRVDSALSRLESMVEERLRAETLRAEELARRLTRLEQQHDDLRKIAAEVEGRLERAMEYIRSLLEADQK
jgi:hypothetical protein